MPWRPVMLNGYERQFVYVYGAVSPLQGDFDWMLCGEMNALRRQANSWRKSAAPIPTTSS
ncbi:MAG: hypothetical protein ACREU0_01255 [Burkholderiales bacterium]